MVSSLDKLASNLCSKRWIQCDKCKSDVGLENIFCKNIALQRFKRCKAKKTKDLDERMLKKCFNHTSSYRGCDEKFCLMILKGVYSYEYMDSWERFEETKLPLKKCILQQAKHERCKG